MYTSWIALSSLFPLCVSAQGLTNNQIDTVKQRLAEGATHRLAFFSPLHSFSHAPPITASWEIGTRAQALLELSAPPFSVFTPAISLPPPTSLDPNSNDTLADVYTIARNIVAALPAPPSNGTGQPLVLNDGSAGDPASTGVAVLIANWTDLSGQYYYYATAATAQVEYLFGPAVPKTPDGAISHRVSQVQLWCAGKQASLAFSFLKVLLAATGAIRCTWCPPSLRIMVSLRETNRCCKRHTRRCVWIFQLYLGWAVGLKASK